MKTWFIALVCALAVPVAAGAQPVHLLTAQPLEQGEAGSLRAQRGNDPIWDGALKGFAVGGGTLLALYAYSWKHEGEAPTVTGGLATAVGVIGGVGALIGIAVDAHHSTELRIGERAVLRPLLSRSGGGAALSVSW